MLYALEENNEDETFILEKIEILRGLKLSDKDIAGVINSLYGLHKNKIKEILLNKKVTS